MSATTRSRKSKSTGKGKNKNTRRSVQPSVRFDTKGFESRDLCGCPACAGAEVDLGEVIDELTGELIEFQDALDAELAGAAFVSVGTAIGADFEQALIEGLVPEFEARATAGSLAMLLSIAAIAPRESSKAASAAAVRLAGAGVALPSWAAELDDPIGVTDCVRLHDTQGIASVLAGSFHRGTRSHAFVVTVDDLDCGAASDIFVLDPDGLPQALDDLQASGRDDGLEIVREALDAADFRWHVENALDARATHDGDRLEDSLPADEDGPGYPALALLLRARVANLPAPDKPAAPHRGAGGGNLAALQMLAQLTGGAGFAASPQPVRALPAKRTKADGAAPMYRIKVQLRGSKPPIWRRLEVPADISLARLHAVLQVAFDWHGGHLHVFTTPYGDFGTADADLGHRPEATVTLEQVAPDPSSKITYTYDFGDDWEHVIVVEKVLGRGKASSSPRCTGGRRAAPPEDCGGMWGYAELAEILSDPADPEHEERLEWLGLADAADFVPASFDAETVSSRLARLR